MLDPAARPDLLGRIHMRVRRLVLEQLDCTDPCIHVQRELAIRGWTCFLSTDVTNQCAETTASMELYDYEDDDPDEWADRAVAHFAVVVERIKTAQLEYRRAHVSKRRPQDQHLSPEFLAWTPESGTPLPYLAESVVCAPRQQSPRIARALRMAVDPSWQPTADMTPAARPTVTTGPNGSYTVDIGNPTTETLNFQPTETPAEREAYLQAGRDAFASHRWEEHRGEPGRGKGCALCALPLNSFIAHGGDWTCPASAEQLQHARDWQQQCHERDLRTKLAASEVLHGPRVYCASEED